MVLGGAGCVDESWDEIMGEELGEWLDDFRIDG